MRYVAAYLLATINDDKSVPTAEKIKNILASVGVEADKTSIDMVIKRFAGQQPTKVIDQGSDRLASVGGGVSAASAAGGAPAAGGAAPAEEKKPEKKEEEEEESDDDMGFGLFD